jgi:hypothetical protein
MTDQELIAKLTAAVEAADLYLNSYDTSAPSRIKAETRLAIEEAIGAISAREDAAPDDWEGPPTPEYREDDDEAYDEMVRDDLRFGDLAR